MSITNVITRITVDMAGDVKRFAVKAKQYDRATRVIVVSLLWDEVPYVLDSADAVRCNVHKPDGTIAIVEGDNIAVSGNTVTITLPGTALTAAGRAWADIEIETQDESQQVSCQCFEIDIAKSPVDDDSIISTNEFSAMKLATKAANEAAAAATAEIEATAAAGTAASQAAAAAQAATEAANQAAAAATASVQIDPTLTDNTKAAPAGMVGQIKEDLNALDEDLSAVTENIYSVVDISSADRVARNNNYIKMATSTLENDVGTAPVKTIYIPVDTGKKYRVTCSISSTKRYGFCDAKTGGTSITSATQVTGTLDVVVENTDKTYLVIQFFAANDSNTKILGYLNHTVVSELTGITATDSVTRAFCKSIDGIDTDENSFTGIVLSNNYIDKNTNTIAQSLTNSVVSYDIAGYKHIVMTCPISSRKKIAFANEPATSGLVVNNLVEYYGQLDTLLATNGYRYVIVQYFTSYDAEQDINEYLNAASVKARYAVDYYARELIRNGRFFHTENLTGLGILDNFTDVTVVTSAYDDSVAFHALVGDMCSNSNGYITQTYMGTDAHENALYYYRTHPKELRYGANRRPTIPEYPITGGNVVKPFRVILTSNIHADEHNGNWVVYNMLQKMLNPASDMMRFLRNNCEIIWIPYITPTGTYANVDGQNVNRAFPSTVDGVCTSPEATLVKGVFDTFGADADLHLDIHTFPSGTVNSEYFATWIFTDDAMLGSRAVRVTEDVLIKYREKYPDITEFQRGTGSFTNITTTSSNYMQTVYGVPAGTIEGQATLSSGRPSDVDLHTNAVAYLYDFVTQVIVAMARA